MKDPAPFGYHGCYLRIDVSRGSVDRVPLPEAVLRQFLGGSGLGAWLLLEEGDPAADPLAADAPLVFAFSPLVGSPLTTSAKFAVVSKSPLTDRINDSLASSGFAIAGKRCGCDAIVIVGRAAQLSVLIVDDGRVRLESAEDLRGATCQATEATLKARLGADYQIASIGPAGERAVRYATISHDGRHAGRGGSGAVLGSKNVKAIAVRGTQRCEWAHPRELTEYSKNLSKRSFGPATAKYRELGTATNLLTFNRLGALPTRNFQSGTFEGAASISPEQIRTTHTRTRASCVACTIGCEHIYAIGDENGVRLEYESLFALGSLCGVSDPDAVLRASRLCDELGIDTISAGGTIAFAMECVERGWLDEPWLTFGSGDAMLRAIELDWPPRGPREPAGRGQPARGRDDRAPQHRVRAAGQGPRDSRLRTASVADDGPGLRRRLARRRPQPERRLRGRFLGQGGSPARRRWMRFTMPSKPRTRPRSWTRSSSASSCAGCSTDFYAEAADMLQRVTGWDATADELRETARRIVGIKRQFNLLAGWTLDEDTLPERFLNTPLPSDPTAALSREQLGVLVAEYHRQRGW